MYRALTRQGYSHKEERKYEVNRLRRMMHSKGNKRDGVFDEYDHKIHRMGRIGTFVSLILVPSAIGIPLFIRSI